MRLERSGRAVAICTLWSPVAAGSPQQALAGLNEDWARRGIATLDNGIGLASGQVMVGQIGSPRRMEFTVIGDTVNLAARLESATRHGDAAVVCDAQTAHLIQASR